MILDSTIPEILFPKITFIISNVSFYRIVSFRYINVTECTHTHRENRENEWIGSIDENGQHVDSICKAYNIAWHNIHPERKR